MLRTGYVRALVAALAVAVPLPVVGTVLGLAGLFWSGTASRGQLRS